MFISKIYSLNEALAKSKTRGGNGVKRVFAQWTKKTIRQYSANSFKIYYNELNCEKLQSENSDLKD